VACPQVWFSHRRRKEKADQAKLLQQQHAEAAPAGASPPGNAMPHYAAAGATLGLTPPAAAQPAAGLAAAPALSLASTSPTGAAVLPSGEASHAGGPALGAAAGPSFPRGSLDQGLAAAATQLGLSVGPSAPTMPPAAKAPAKAAAKSAKPVEPALSPISAEEVAELLEAAKRMLPVPFREDGPPLAIEFDDILSGVAASRKGAPSGLSRRSPGPLCVCVWGGGHSAE
jgi:hypothetical protein